MHPSLALEDRHALRVDDAPDAAAATRSEANRVARFVDAAANAVDPPEAQGFVDRFGPGDARLARAALVEADEQLGCRLVVRFEPRAKIRRRFEECRFHPTLAPLVFASRTICPP